MSVTLCAKRKLQRKRRRKKTDANIYHTTFYVVFCLLLEFTFNKSRYRNMVCQRMVNKCSTMEKLKLKYRSDKNTRHRPPHAANPPSSHDRGGGAAGRVHEVRQVEALVDRLKGKETDYCFPQHNIFFLKKKHFFPRPVLPWPRRRWPWARSPRSCRSGS